MRDVTALIGAQFGSEGKGRMAQHFASQFDVHVRTGGPNAGHTIHHNGETFKMRSVPCGWVNPDADLVIGAGGVVHLELLKAEVADIEARGGEAGATIRERLMIDPRVHLITQQQELAEGGTGGDAHRNIGSTGEGVGACRIGRINRGSIYSGLDAAPLMDYDEELEGAAKIEDTVQFLDRCRGGAILLEGTQGSGLSLTHGPWPFTTSADTNTAGLLADAGVAPERLKQTVAVARTHPIRVAGNSGPLPKETSFDEMGLPEEHTTVTGKVRRIARWDDGVVERMLQINGRDSTILAVTFLDYLFPGDTGKTDWGVLSREAKDWVTDLEKRMRVSVGWLGTGGPDLAVLNCGGLV